MTPAEMDALYARVMELDSKRTPGDSHLAMDEDGEYFALAFGDQRHKALTVCRFDLIKESKAKRSLKERNDTAQFLGAAPDMIRLLRAQHEQLLAMRVAIECERESGTCSRVHDPERSDCTPENCHFAFKAARKEGGNG